MRTAKYRVGQWVRFEDSPTSKKEFRVLEVVTGKDYGPAYQLQHFGPGVVLEKNLISWDEYEDIARRDQAIADRDNPGEYSYYHLDNCTNMKCKCGE